MKESDDKVLARRVIPVIRAAMSETWEDLQAAIQRAELLGAPVHEAQRLLKRFESWTEKLERYLEILE